VGGTKPESPPAPETGLKEILGHCKVAAIDESVKYGAGARWSLTPGEHTVMVDCTFAIPGTKGRGSMRTWNANYLLTFVASEGRRYEVKDHLDGLEAEYVWIEDVETGEVVGGNRPSRFGAPKLTAAGEIKANREKLGGGATLEVAYKAPSKPINHVKIALRGKTIIDFDGNTDLNEVIDVQPGFFAVMVRIQDRARFEYKVYRLSMEVEDGDSRTLRIKARSWGDSSVRLGK
jgi:hypothetical protein